MLAALRTLRSNIASFRAEQRCDVRAASVHTLGPAQQTPDVLLIDPPYGTGAGAVALDRLKRLGWLAPSTWISVETERSETLDVKGYTLDAARNVGKARLHLLRFAGD